MRTGVLKKLRPEAREKAKAAARRAGQSVEEWLDNVITQSADADEDEDFFEDDNDAVQERLDALTRKIDRLTATGPAAYAPLRARKAAPAEEQVVDPAEHLTEMVERLDRRLDHFVQFAHAMPSVVRRGPAAPQQPQAQQVQQARPLSQAVAEVAARQRMLRGEPAAPPHAAPRQPQQFAQPFAQPFPQRPMGPPVDAQYAHAAGYGDPETIPQDGYAPPAAPQMRAQPAPMQAMPQPMPQPVPQAMPGVGYPQPAMQPQPHQYAAMPAQAYAPPPATLPSHMQQAAAHPAVQPRVAPAPAPAPVLQPQAPLPAQDLSGLESQLRAITNQIETLRKPGVEEAINALREELSQIAQALTDAMPRHVIDAIDAQIQNLAQRLSEGRQAGVGEEVLSSIEQHLGDIHGALRSLTPAENLDGFNETVHALAQRIDLIVAQKDPSSFAQLEDAINNLRAMSAHIASNDAVQQLAAQVQALAGKVDQIAYTSSGDAALAHLEQRIATLSDAIAARNQSGGSVPQHLEHLVGSLADKIEQIQMSRSDGMATSHLEDRIVQLAAKLDASDSRLANLEAVERGLGDLLAQTERLTRAHEQTRQQAPVEAAPATEHVDALRRDVARTQDSLESVHSTLGILVDRLAAIETGMRERAQAAPVHLPPAPTLNQPVDAVVAQVVAAAAQMQAHPQPQAAAPAPQALPVAEAPPLAPAPQPAARQAAPAAAPKAAAKLPPRRSQPIDPDLPPDHPIEPGMARPTAARAGASAVAVAPPSAAARIAASEAALNGGRPPVIADPAGQSNFIAAARRAAKAAEQDPGSPIPVPPRANLAEPAPTPSRFSFGRPSRSAILGKLKSMLIASSVVAIVVGGYYIIGSALDGDSAAPAMPQAPKLSKPNSTSAGALDGPQIKTPAIEPGSNFKLLAPDSTIQTAPAPLPETPSSADPEATHSIGKRTSYPDKLPQAFSQTLRDAAANGDASAAYEVATRYAEGQGVASSLEEAARWFDRAAQQGLAPAQFRLGSFYEKGQGVRRDLKAARKLYVAAADQGNAKAMHNLAVLYAEGVDGKPDYKTASEWFLKASAYGVPDSQYNLAILYARGLGVEKSLIEAYKWFSLAAAQGDKEAAKKRDEVGARLDPASRTTAENTVKTFTPRIQPAEAIRVASPPGGWDRPSESDARPVVRPMRLGSR
jgi:localization factor PodJL